MFSQDTIEAVKVIAQREGVSPAALLAVAEVESAGSVFAEVNGKALPVIRWEGHYFDRLVHKSKRAEARRKGLASPKAGAVKNPRKQYSRYAILRNAMTLDKDAAIQSCSWGLGQVMGSHWEALGYASPEALVKEAKSGAVGQIELMVRFIVKNKLTGYIRALDWAGFSYRYNGRNYKKNRYDTRMARAYERWAIKLGEVESPVYDLQKNLNLLGYDAGPPDGVEGPRTKNAIREFQAENGLLVDGLAGYQTHEVINELLAERTERAMQKRATKEKTKTGVTAGVGAGAGAGVIAAAPVVAEAAQDISGLVDSIKGLDLPGAIGMGLTVFAVVAAVGIYFYSRRRTV